MYNGSARYETPIYLNIYDISPMNGILHPIGLGLYHTGIEINDIEYVYGMGITEVTPKEDIDFAVFKETIELGKVKLRNSEIMYNIHRLSKEFTESNYNTVLKNCNDFSNALSEALLGKGIPSYINRMANTGKILYNFYNNVHCGKKKRENENQPFHGKSHRITRGIN